MSFVSVQELSTNGATGSYERELRELEEKLRKIREILDQSQVSEQDVVDLKRQLADIKTQLKEEVRSVNSIGGCRVFGRKLHYRWLFEYSSPSYSTPPSLLPHFEYLSLRLPVSLSFRLSV